MLVISAPAYLSGGNSAARGTGSPMTSSDGGPVVPGRGAASIESPGAVCNSTSSIQ
jgi:hypothetical protein